MTNTVTNILSHDEELALRKPIEDYVGKIQAEIDELREEGTNKVLEYSEEIEVLKRDKIYTKSEKEARISELNGKLQKAKEIEAKNKQPINDKIAVAEKYLKDHYQTDYYNKVVESNKYEVQKAKADYDKKLKELEKEHKDILSGLSDKEEIKEEADKVRKAGGLFILGTERHDARRIDNQLRGRAGRQGDPGVSQFFLSLEDDLMRLFGGDRMQRMMSKLTDDEDMPIVSKLVTKTIESSQQKVEGRNFGIRKNTLQYDDVMNRQRELIYKQRDMVLDGIDLTETITKMIDQNIKDTVENYFSGEKKEDWNVEGLKEKYKSWLICDDDDFTDIENLTVLDAVELLQDRAHKRIEEKSKILGEEMFQDFARMVLLRLSLIHI